MKRIEDYKTRINELISLADKTIASKYMTQFGDTYTNTETFNTFRSASLSFLQNVYGVEHSFYKEFTTRCKDVNPWDSDEGKGILLSVKHELDNGWLFTVKSLVSSEIFSDFLEMANYLLVEKYKDPAAVMIGSVLEEHLRQLCLKNNIPVEVTKNSQSVFKKADQLNSDLAGANIYNKLEQKSVTAWLDLRNKAAHGKYSEYSQAQVEIMYTGVLDFINRNSISH